MTWEHLSLPSFPSESQSTNLSTFEHFHHVLLFSRYVPGLLRLRNPQRSKVFVRSSVPSSSDKFWFILPPTFRCTGSLPSAAILPARPAGTSSPPPTSGAFLVDTKEAFSSSSSIERPAPNINSPPLADLAAFQIEDPSSWKPAMRLRQNMTRGKCQKAR